MGKVFSSFQVVLIVLLNALLAFPTIAAEQGKAGKRSTATAKITLTIPPRSASHSLAQKQNTVTARDFLKQVCLNKYSAQTKTNQKDGFSVSLINADNEAMLATVINAHCQSSLISASTYKTASTAVLLVAPR